MIHAVGLDVVEISRLRRALARFPALAARLFTPDERAYCERHADPAPHYAARFAAKEALAKAVGRHLRWQEVEVVREARGRPVLRLSGASADWAGLSRGAEFLLSLTHSQDHAAAVVVLQFPSRSPEDPLPPRVLV